MRISTVLAVVVVLASLSLLLPSAVDMDPYMWATWAREVVHLRLSTVGGPAWKPLPVLVDVVFTPFGQAETWMWLVVARAGALLAVTMTYRLARRLADWRAGTIAAVGLVLSPSFLELLAPWGMSEPLLAGLVLLAVERHLDARYGQAYGLTFAALLLRPEAFPFFVAYSAFMMARSPRSRWWVLILMALLPVLWILPDYLSSGDWLRSVSRARMPTQGGPLLSAYPAVAVVRSASRAVLLPWAVGAAIAVVFAVVGYVKRREERVAFALSVLCVAWLLVVAVTAQARVSSGDQRYLIISTALGCVLAGVGWTRVVGAATSGSRRMVRGVGGSAARWAVITALLLGAAPSVAYRLGELSDRAGEMPYQAHKYHELGLVIRRAGRERILACRPITSDPYKIPALAWHLGIAQSEILIGVRPTGTVFRTPPNRNTAMSPPQLGSPGFRIVAQTDQWQVLNTCGGRSSPD